MALTKNKMLISVVDDDASLRKTVSRIVRSGGLDVVTYASAEEFLESGGQDGSACLILDYNLPGISGVDLQERLNRSGSRIPIIFISADADEPIREKALRAGAARFLSKPFSVSSLLDAVRATLPVPSNP